jgi:NitT/TauT family transport system permease protein
LTDWRFAARQRAPRRPDDPAQLVTLGFVTFPVLTWGIAALYVPPYLLPSPLAVFTGILRFLSVGQLSAHLLTTLSHTVISVTLAISLGFLMSLAVFLFPLFSQMVHGRIGPGLNALSAIGWVFLAMVWFGLGNATVILIVTGVCLPLCLNVLKTGFAALDHDLLEMGDSFGTEAGVFFSIVLPSLFPYFLSALRVSFSMAWKVVLTAEMFAGNNGLGYLFNVARQSYDSTMIFVIIVMILICMLGIEYLVLGRLHKRITRHYAP